MGMWEEVLICARQTNRSYNRAPRDSPSASFTTEANQMRLQLQIFLFLTHSLLLPPSLYAASLIFLSFRHSSPLLLLLSSASQWVWALGGKEGVIWSLWALIKTSVWLSGISCADVWVSVYFSVVLWLHDNLPLFFLSPVFALCCCFSQGIDEASSKDKWVFCPQFFVISVIFCY